MSLIFSSKVESCYGTIARCELLRRFKDGFYFIFIFSLGFIGWLGKNTSLLIAAIFLMVLKLTTLDSKVFPFLEGKGISLGVTIITIAVLVPIASGSIGFKDLGEAIKSPYAWIALVSGIAVALLAKNGLILLKS